MCRKLTNLCQNFVTETCKQCSEATRHRLCCEKLGTSHDVKGFATGSSLEYIVVERANDDLCQKNITNAGLICAKPIDFQRNLPENNHKICRFFTDCFLAKFALKIPVKSTDFSAICLLKIKRNLTFFPQPIRSPALTRLVSIGKASMKAKLEYSWVAAFSLSGGNQ